MSNKSIKKITISDSINDNYPYFINEFSDLIKPLLFGKIIEERSLKFFLNSNTKFFKPLFSSTVAKMLGFSDDAKSYKEINEYIKKNLKYARIRFFDIQGNQYNINYNPCSEWEKFKRSKSNATFSDQLYRIYYYSKDIKIKMFLITDLENLYNEILKKIEDTDASSNGVVLLKAIKNDSEYKFEFKEEFYPFMKNMQRTLEEVYNLRHSENISGKLDIFYLVGAESEDKPKYLLSTITFSLLENATTKFIHFINNINNGDDRKIIKAFKNISILLSSAVLTSELQEKRKTYVGICGNEIWDALFKTYNISEIKVDNVSIITELHKLWQKLVTPSCIGKKQISRTIMKSFIEKFPDHFNRWRTKKEILKEFIKPLQTMLDFEDTLKLAGFRDHFIHSFHVFIIGLIIWPKICTKYLEKIDSSDNKHIIKKLEISDATIWGKDNDFLFLWFITSIWHDISYPVANTSHWLSEMLKKLMNVEENVRAIHVHTDIFRDEIYHNALKEISREIGCSESKIIQNLIEERIKKKKGNEEDNNEEKKM